MLAILLNSLVLFMVIYKSNLEDRYFIQGDRVENYMEHLEEFERKASEDDIFLDKKLAEKKEAETKEKAGSVKEGVYE